MDPNKYWKVLKVQRRMKPRRPLKKRQSWWRKLRRRVSSRTKSQNSAYSATSPIISINTAGTSQPKQVEIIPALSVLATTTRRSITTARRYARILVHMAQEWHAQLAMEQDTMPNTALGQRHHRIFGQHPLHQTRPKRARPGSPSSETLYLHTIYRRCGRSLVWARIQQFGSGTRFGSNVRRLTHTSKYTFK